MYLISIIYVFNINNNIKFAGSAARAEGGDYYVYIYIHIFLLLTDLNCQAIV